MDLFARFRSGLARTREKIGDRIGFLFRSRKSEKEFYEDLEEVLVSADAGMETTLALVGGFRELATREGAFGDERMARLFRDYLVALFSGEPFPGPSPAGLEVVLLLGVNGSGKTTTAAKLAAQAKAAGRKPMLAAADTFRAAAIDQLAEWGERLSVPVIRQHPGADPGAVVFDAIQAARSRQYDYLIVDTAGRFHNKENLVRELEKVDRVARSRITEQDRYSRIVVLDATAGGNAYAQAKGFHEAVPLDAVILAKADSSARGGVALAVAHGMRIPIWMVGLGEGVDDLVPFSAEAFVDALL
jgi:fused signal recognition particle receptor